MALVLADRVKETTASTGTGAITLAGASTGYQSFAVIGNGNTTYYTIAGGNEWEVGIGTYTASGAALSRDTVLASSNSGSLVNFSVGSKDVFVAYPAEKSVNQNGSVISAGTAVLGVANGGTNGTATPTAGAVSYGTGTAYAFTSAGTAGQVLLSNGSSAPSFGGIDGGTF